MAEEDREDVVSPRESLLYQHGLTVNPCSAAPFVPVMRITKAMGHGQPTGVILSAIVLNIQEMNRMNSVLKD